MNIVLFIWALLATLALFGSYVLIRRILIKVKDFVQNWLELRADLLEFTQHLQEVYKLPAYFEEPTLKALLQHTNFVFERCEEFDNETFLLNIFSKEEADAFVEEHESSFNPSEEMIGDMADAEEN